MAVTIEIPSHRVRVGRVARFFRWFMPICFDLRKEARLLRRYLSIIEQGIPDCDYYSRIFDAGASKMDRLLLWRGGISTAFTFAHGNVCFHESEAHRNFPTDPVRRHEAIVAGTRRQLRDVLRPYSAWLHFRTVYDE